MRVAATPYRLADVTRARQLDRFVDFLAYKALGANHPGHAAFASAEIKASVPGMTTGDLPSLQEPVQAFARLVAERSAFGRLAQSYAVQAAPPTRVPAPIADPPAEWVGEGRPIPVARARWTHAVMAEYALATIFVVSQELLRTSDPRTRALITRQASRQLARALDARLLSTMAATDSSPAGLLAAAPSVGGGSPQALERDVAELYAYVSDGRAGTPVFVLSPRAALYLAASDQAIFRNLGVNGGTIGGVPAITTPAAGSALILIDADMLAVHDGGVEVQRSEAATVEMSDAPTQDATTATGAVVVSLFQTGMAGVKLVQYADWRLLADDAIGYIELTELGSSPA